MQNFNLKMSNGTVANSAETISADIGVRNRKIVAIGKRLGDAEQVIDASGKYALREVMAADMHDNMEVTSYEGMRTTSWPTILIKRGEVIIEDDEFRTDRGAGRLIPRKTIDCTGMPGMLAPELNPTLNFGVNLGL